MITDFLRVMVQPFYVVQFVTIEIFEGREQDFVVFGFFVQAQNNVSWPPVCICVLVTYVMLEDEKIIVAQCELLSSQVKRWRFVYFIS